jgi:hypothetical protein
LVLSPTGSINLGFTTEGRLDVVLIITFSWGFQLGGYISIITTSTPHHQGPTLSTRIEACVDIKLFSGSVVGEVR